MNSQGIAPQTLFADQFRVVKLLATGGMGSVYEVEQVATGHPRALKVILPKYAQDPKARARFEQEARIAARIESEHVAQVIAAGVDAHSNTPWLAMELLQGRDLADALTERGRFEVHEVIETLKQLCHALAAAHRIGVIHRDVKPENIFLATSKRSDAAVTVKVLDFGVAKWIQEQHQAQSTAVVGSPLWMAPEQLDARGILGPHTDIWAVGLVAFAMLVGRPYWKGASTDHYSLPEVVGEIMAAPLVPASQRASEFGHPTAIPQGFDAWFARCVERDPAMRFRDIRETLTTLVHSVIVPHAAAGPVPATAAMPVMMAQGPFASTPPSATPQPFSSQPPPAPQSGVARTVAVPMVSTPVGYAAPPPGAPWPSNSPGLSSYPAPSAYASQQGGAAPVYGAGPVYAAAGAAAPWARPEPTEHRSGGRVIAVVVALFALVCVTSGVAAAYVLLSPACASHEHRSQGHCCPAGSDWESDRAACVCHNPALCGTPTPAPSAVAPVPMPQPQPVMTPTPPPVATPAPLPSTPPTPVPPTQPQRPTPDIGHLCTGVWSGSLLESTGNRGMISLMVRPSAAQCAQWSERWASGGSCTYTLSQCRFTGATIQGVGRTRSPGCSGPVQATITCTARAASFREQVGNVVDTGILMRR